VLDEELARLPEIYRSALILCHLQGQTRKEAALALGILEGTLSSRLAEGRQRLATRLARRGANPGQIAMAIAACQGAGDFALPVARTAQMMDLTWRLHGMIATSSTKPGILMMLFSKWKVALSFVLLAGIGGGGIAANRSEDAVLPAAEKRRLPRPPKDLNWVFQRMEVVGDRLEAGLGGPQTQAMQTQIFRALGAIVAKHEARKLQTRKVIQTIAELKLVEAMQNRVNARTKLYGKQFNGEEAPPIEKAFETIRRELRVLGERQKRIAEITRQLAGGQKKGLDWINSQMELVARRLDSAKGIRQTIRLQGEILTQLDANIQKAASRDVVAEMKMIQAMQKRVLTRTKVYADQFKGEDVPMPAAGKDAKEKELFQTLRSELANLAERQKKIAQITNQLFQQGKKKDK
jgi:hypothetical protein